MAGLWRSARLTLGLAAAAALVACGNGPDAGSARDRAAQARVRDNEKIERNALYYVSYLCAAERRSEALGSISFQRWLTDKGAPGSIHAEWDLFTGFAAGERSERVRLRGIWNSDEAHPADPGPGYFSLLWELYPPVGEAHPRIAFQTMAGEEVPLVSSTPLKDNGPMAAFSFLAWGDVRRAEAKGHGLYATIGSGSANERHIFPLPEHMLASVESTMTALAARTADDARDFRARCKAIEQIPIVD
jgi:hypothetical protein